MESRVAIATRLFVRFSTTGITGIYSTIVEGYRYKDVLCIGSVNPDKTSQTCPICSHVEKSNRVNEQFCCVCCGYKQDADVVGSINIVTRFTAGRYGVSFKAVTMI